MMNFKYIYFLCTFLTVFSSIETSSQTVRTAKSVIEETTSTIGRWIGKKAVKETAEETVEQGTKAISKEMAQRVVAKNSANVIFLPNEKLSHKALQEVTATNIRQTLVFRVSAEVSENALKVASKDFAQQIGKSASKEAQDYFAKRLGTESSQEVYEFSVKKSMQEKAFDSKKNWSEKLEDKFYQLRLELLQKIHKSKIYKELLEIKSKGPISLTEKEMSDLLTHPEYFRSYLKIKVGKSRDVIEFLIRLKQCNPLYVKQILNNPILSSYIKKSIRGNKGVHEWLMVKNVEDFLLNPKWGEDGDFLAMALCKLTQKTDNVLFKVGGKHGSTNSTKFHNGLARVIEQSSSIENLFVNVRRYAKQNLTIDAYNEFLIIFDSVFEAA